MAEDKVATEKSTVTPEQMEEIKAQEYYSIKQIADTLRYSVAHITEMVHRGRIKAFKPLGGRWRIPKSEWERIIKEGIPLPREKIIPGPPPVTEIEIEPEMMQKIKEPEKKEKKWSPFDFLFKE